MEPQDFVTTHAGLDRFRNEIERKKILLSTQNEVRVQVAGVCQRDGQYQDLDETVTRDSFERIIERDVRDAIAEVKKSLEGANVTAPEVDRVLLIGGSSRIPLVRQQLREMFGHRVSELRNANTIIAEGAAIIDSYGLQPILARSLNAELSDGSLYEIFPSGLPVHPDVCQKEMNFICTDNRDGHARLVLKELAGRINSVRKLNKTNMSIPVSKTLPVPYNHERVAVNFAMDPDMVLHVTGKGATQEKGVHSEIYDLCFGLRLERAD